MGDKKPKNNQNQIKEIAKALGYSPSVVESAINYATAFPDRYRSLVREVAEQEKCLRKRGYDKDTE